MDFYAFDDVGGFSNSSFNFTWYAKFGCFPSLFGFSSGKTMLFNM